MGKALEFAGVTGRELKPLNTRNMPKRKEAEDMNFGKRPGFFTTAYGIHGKGRELNRETCEILERGPDF